MEAGEHMVVEVEVEVQDLEVQDPQYQVLEQVEMEEMV
jgi:hypothetical protein